MRYVDRLIIRDLTDIASLVKPEIAGIINTDFKDYIHQTINESLFMIPDEGGQILARWGLISAGTTFDPDSIEPIAEPSWILDLDMFLSKKNQEFNITELMEEAQQFSERLYTFFRWAVQDEFLRRFGDEIRRLTGLTWEQLAKLFNVSRRTLHFWASGKRLNSFNEEQLNLLLDTIRYIDRGSASLNRNLLLMPIKDGKSPFDFLIAGKYQEVKNILGSGNVPQKPKLNPLSEEALKLRRPLSPEILIDALQEPIHRGVGRSRPAKSVRSRKK